MPTQNLNKTAFVTGASVGLGRAIALALADAGYQLVLLARRSQKLHDLQNELANPCHTIACDINDREKLAERLAELPQQFKEIDVLVNNAGLALGMSDADKADWSDWQTMIETNCMSLAFLSRQILPGMRERNAGHIVNMGSTAGNYAYRGGNVYGATKAFVDQFSINLRADLVGTQIRVTNIVPGMIAGTEFSTVRFHGDKDSADAVYAGAHSLLPDDIAESVKWVVTLPEHVNINRLEIMPTCQAPNGLVVSRN